jgi:hypothetical protein
MVKEKPLCIDVHAGMCSIRQHGWLFISGHRTEGVRENGNNG